MKKKYLKDSVKIKVTKSFTNYSFFEPFLELLPFNYKKQKIFCVGLPRSGTHSMSKVLKDYFDLKGEHEPVASVTTNIIFRNQKTNKKKFILKRDKILKYDFEASYYLIHFIDELMEIYPNALFILTVRNPKDWIISNTNSSKKSIGSNNHWERLLNFMYGKPRKDENFVEFGKIYNLKNQLDYYKFHVSTALKKIPNEKLIIIDTYDIENSIEKIADFLKISAKKPIIENVHVAKNIKKKKFQIPDNLAKDCLKICNHFSKKSPVFLRYKENIAN